MLISPKNESAYIELAWSYNEQGKLVAAEEMFKQAIQVSPKADIAYAQLAQFYEQQHRYEDASNMIKEVVRLVRSTDDFSKTTSDNYRKFKDIVLERGIKLVCVQYPRRSIKPLKNLFKSDKGIIFVDNEKIFQDAINKGVYEDYFVDRFAGDFGHANSKGNELLANNIAAVLIREYFSKSPK